VRQAVDLLQDAQLIERRPRKESPWRRIMAEGRKNFGCFSCCHREKIIRHARVRVKTVPAIGFQIGSTLENQIAN
jgi:hypothetical protein